MLAHVFIWNINGLVWFIYLTGPAHHTVGQGWVHMFHSLSWSIVVIHISAWGAVQMNYPTWLSSIVGSHSKWGVGWACAHSSSKWFSRHPKMRLRSLKNMLHLYSCVHIARNVWEQINNHVYTVRRSYVHRTNKVNRTIGSRNDCYQLRVTQIFFINLSLFDFCCYVFQVVSLCLLFPHNGIAQR